jgi:uncharacterized tellurite resistance protein B-like protein
MEVAFFLFLFIGIPLIRAIYDRATTPSDEVYSPTLGTIRSSVPSLECRINEDSVDIDGERIEVLKLEVKGGIPTGTGIAFLAHLVTEKECVRCFLPNYQEVDSLNLQVSAPQVSNNPNADLFWPDWVCLSVVPLLTLQGPEGGHQNIRLQVSAIQCEAGEDGWILPQFHFGKPLGGKRLVAQLHSPWKRLTLAPLGYLEAEKQQGVWMESTVKIAFSMAVADGNVDKEEATLIKEWVKKNLQGMSDADSVKNRINASISRISNGGFDIDITAAIETLCEAPEYVRFQAVELITEVLAVDGEAGQSEIALRNKVINNLQLDPEECRALLDKRIAMDGLSITADNSPLAALGIPEGLPQAELRKRLNAEFRKWNGRITHQDPKVREQAERMLSLIASGRDSLVGQGSGAVSSP